MGCFSRYDRVERQAGRITTTCATWWQVALGASMCRLPWHWNLVQMHPSVHGSGTAGLTRSTGRFWMMLA
jgi:hypothetical protein